MYGIVEIQGHQYKVTPGDIIDVEKLEGEIKKEFELDKVLFIAGDSPVVGKPTISGAKVTAKVLRQDRGRKKIVLRRSPGKYCKKNGHRQNYTSLLITSIVGEGVDLKMPADHKNAKKA